jgi:hypothetical protein
MPMEIVRIMPWTALQGVPERLFLTLLEICRVGGQINVNMTTTPCCDSFSQVAPIVMQAPAAAQELPHDCFEVIMIGRQVIQRKGPSQ